MKKFFAFGLIALLFAVVQFVVPHQTVPADKDVGYSLVMDQNTSVVTILPVQCPVVAGESDYLFTRGSSVIDKGLIDQDALITYNQENFECGIYYTIDRIDFKLPTLTGFEDQPDKYPFASDLGTWERYSKINAV